MSAALSFSPADHSLTRRAITDRLAELDAIADRYLESERPRTTRDAYAQDWATWQDYTRWAGLPILSGTRGALVGFVVWLENGSPRRSEENASLAASLNTIRRRIAGVLHGLRQHHAEIDPSAPQAAAAALAAYKRRLAQAGEARGRGQAHLVDLPAVLAMSRACPNTLAGLRDRAMIVIGFYAATRASDQAGLLATDLRAEHTGLVVHVRVGKTTGVSALPRRRHPLLCPLRAWAAWEAAADEPHGPAFRAIDRHGRLGSSALSPDSVTAIIGRAGKRAQLPYPVTCHSLRAGFATESYRSGASLIDIAEQGRWAPGSQELFRYIRSVEQWEHNAADGLDLDPDQH
jgi:integrase